MITINLIPTEKKQELKLTQFYIIIKNLIILILLLTAIISIILLLIKMTLQNHFNKIVEQTTLTTKYANIFNKDIKDFNKKLKAVEMIQENHTLWINFFIDFVKLVPDNINLQNITINGNKILITGSAETRDKLLNFKENLENSDLLSQVVIPLDNLLKKEDVDFDLKADINLDELKIL